jgi:molybdate transport system ATP-binding protein
MTLTVQIRKRLSAIFALDVAFAAAPGVTIVFGESGSGKSTLLRCVAGLTMPDDGAIAIGERVVFDRARAINIDPAMRRMGYVFQHLALFPHLTVAGNIGYGLAGVPRPDRDARIAAIAESFRIGHLLGRRPGEISGGERQRVGLARSLVTSPEMLLLDEPLSGLDHATQSKIIEDLRDWNAARGIPILYVTHSQREVFGLGERALVLQNGSVIADGLPQDVMNAPSHEGVAQLAGFENLLDAVVSARHPEMGVMTCRLKSAGLDLETPMADLPIGAPVRIAIRAGDIMIATERPRGLSARNIVAGTIWSVSRQGAAVLVRVDMGTMIDVHVTPTASDELDLRPGRAVWVVVKTHSCRPVSAI